MHASLVQREIASCLGWEKAERVKVERNLLRCGRELNLAALSLGFTGVITLDCGRRATSNPPSRVLMEVYMNMKQTIKI